MAGAEKATQPLIATQVGSAHLGPEFRRTTQMGAKTNNHQQIGFDGAVNTVNVFGLNGDQRLGSFS